MTNLNKWSTTAATNATADGTLWAEGQTAASVNNSARDNMASVARYRDDLGGALTTGGSATAYTATTITTGNTDTQVLRDGFRICVEWHATNTAADPTLAVDGGTAKTVKKQDGTALIAGDLLIGVRDDLTYNAGTGTFQVMGVRPEKTGSWTPVLTFATAGDLSVAYTTQSAQYTRNGRSVLVEFSILTSTFTHTTASGQLKITGLPYTVGFATRNGVSWSGITKANYTDVAIQASAATTELRFVTSGSGQPVVGVDAADMPTGGTVALIGSITYTV